MPYSIIVFIVYIGCIITFIIQRPKKIKFPNEHLFKKTLDKKALFDPPITECVQVKLCALIVWFTRTLKQQYDPQYSTIASISNQLQGVLILKPMEKSPFKTLLCTIASIYTKLKGVSLESMSYKYDLNLHSTTSISTQLQKIFSLKSM